jgi:imidazolonepropionase-like amidohydrolase
LYPEWIQRQTAQQAFGFAVDPRGGNGKMLLDVARAGATVVAGTDTPNAINLHGEIMFYTMAGMSTFDALKTATVNPAQVLGFDGGTIEPGKLADLIAIDGDPLTNIASTTKVKKVIANGRVFDVADLLKRRQ